jgi:hypothetical protein
MATSKRLRPWQYRLLGILIGGTVVVALVIATATVPAHGQTNADVGSLDVSGVNKTVDGNVSTVNLQTDIAWEFDVPDASRRIVSVSVGPSKDNMEQIGFRQDTNPGGQGTGTVSIAGDVTETPLYTADDFDPKLAGNKTTVMVVRATVEVRRANGEPVTATATDTVTISLEDGATLSVSVGGSGDVTITTT